MIDLQAAQCFNTTQVTFGQFSVSLKGPWSQEFVTTGKQAWIEVSPSLEYFSPAVVMVPHDETKVTTVSVIGRNLSPHTIYSVLVGEFSVSYTTVNSTRIDITLPQALIHRFH